MNTLRALDSVAPVSSMYSFTCTCSEEVAASLKLWSSTRMDFCKVGRIFPTVAGDGQRAGSCAGHGSRHGYRWLFPTDNNGRRTCWSLERVLMFLPVS